MSFKMRLPRAQGVPPESFLRPNTSVTLCTIKGGSVGGCAVLKWTNPPAPQQSGRKKKPPPLDLSRVQVVVEELPSKQVALSERELDVAAARARLEALLPLPATDDSPIFVFAKDTSAGVHAATDSDPRAVERVEKNMADVWALLEGLPVSHVGYVESSSLARTMKVSFAAKGGQALLERARACFPQVAEQLKNKTRHGRLAEALIVAAHIVGVQPVNAPAAAADAAAAPPPAPTPAIAAVPATAAVPAAAAAGVPASAAVAPPSFVMPASAAPVMQPAAQLMLQQQAAAMAAALGGFPLSALHPVQIPPGFLQLLATYSGALARPPALLPQAQQAQQGVAGLRPFLGMPPGMSMPPGAPLPPLLVQAPPPMRQVPGVVLQQRPPAAGAGPPLGLPTTALASAAPPTPAAAAPQQPPAGGGSLPVTVPTVPTAPAISQGPAPTAALQQEQQQQAAIAAASQAPEQHGQRPQEAPAPEIPSGQPGGQLPVKQVQQAAEGGGSDRAAAAAPGGALAVKEEQDKQAPVEVGQQGLPGVSGAAQPVAAVPKEEQLRLPPLGSALAEGKPAPSAAVPVAVPAATQEAQQAQLGGQAAGAGGNGSRNRRKRKSASPPADEEDQGRAAAAKQRLQQPRQAIGAAGAEAGGGAGAAAAGGEQGELGVRPAGRPPRREASKRASAAWHDV